MTRRGVKPHIPPAARRRQRTHCSRGHEISGYNACCLRAESNPVCRACHTTNNWARRHNLFYDDPRVIERANELFAKYREMTP